MPCHPQSVRPKTQVLPDRVARRWVLFIGLMSMLCIGGTFGAESPLLVNPAERFFAEAPPVAKSKAKFSDNDILDVVRPSNIRQASGEAPGVWDNPAPTTPTEATLADWGAAPTLVAPTINTPPPPAITPPAAHFHAAGIDPAFGFDPQAHFSHSLYANPYAGFGHHDPNSVGLYANPYGVFGNDGVNYGGYYDPMQMIAQQMQYHPFPQGLNTPFPNHDALEPPPASEKRPNTDAGADEEKKTGSEWTMQRLMPLKVSSPLGETLLQCAKVISPFNTPTGPDKGCGQPLMMRSWQDRPCYFGGFVGYIHGSQLVADMIDQRSGANGGLKFGYYFNDYWGVESRLHFASIDIRETDYGRQIYDDWYAATFPEMPYRPLTTRSNHLTTFDVSVQYYPLGNAKWRPFFTYGLGFTRESFIDTFGVNNRVDALSMPIGIGLRYWWNEHLAIQADLVDNIVFSTGQAKTQGNFAFTVGVSYAFGTSKKRRPTAYWPYTPSMGSRW